MTESIRFAGCFAATLLLPVAVLLLLLPEAPFPRVFLPFLPTVTFCALFALRDHVKFAEIRYLWLAGLVIANGFGWERSASAITERSVRAGGHPQGLLRQYYRGDTSFSEFAGWLARNHSRGPGLILTDAYDFPTARYYAGIAGVDPELILGIHRIPGPKSGLRSDLRSGSGPGTLMVLAVNERCAKRLLQGAAEDDAVELVRSFSGRNLYRSATASQRNQLYK